jgi:hypothetical protein
MKTLIELCEADPMDMVRLKHLVHGERMAYALNFIKNDILPQAKTLRKAELVRLIRSALNDLGVDVNELVP